MKIIKIVYRFIRGMIFMIPNTVKMTWELSTIIVEQEEMEKNSMYRNSIQSIEEEVELH